MATNQQKLDARAKREAATKAAQAKEKRNKQLQILAGVVFAALVAVVLVVVIGGGGGSSTKAETGTPEAVEKGDVAGVAETKTLLTGVEQNGLTIGKKDAPIQVLEFIDVQCPFCRDHQLDVQPKLVTELVKSGEAKITLAPIALPMMGPDSEAGRTVLARLADKDKAWDFANLFFFNQGNEGVGYVTDAYLKGLVGAIPGTTPADASRDNDEATTKKLDEVDRWQDELGVTGTPSFFVGKTGTDIADFEQVESSGPDASEAIIAKVRELSGEDQ